jgi:MFS family permease
LTAAFELYRANAVKLIQIVAIVVIPLTFVLALLTKVTFKVHCDANDVQNLQDLQNFANKCTSGVGRSLLIGAIGWFVAVAIQQLILGAVTRGGASAVLGRPVDVEGSYRYAFSRIGGLIVLALLIALAVFLGFFVFIVGALIVGVFLAVAVPAFIIERIGATDSMSRSWKLVRGHWWHTLGVIFVAAILAGIVNGILGAFGGSNFFLYWIFTAIAQCITAPFVALVAVILYIDLRARHEGLTADQLGGQLDAMQ